MSEAPVVLLILDGFGISTKDYGNALRKANMPHIEKLRATCPSAFLACSGNAVGLPDGYMGNSEVGHINIGAGRIVYQDSMRIDMAIESGEIATNLTLSSLFATIKHQKGRLHLMGLLSDGGVHSHCRHIKELIRLADAQNIPMCIHIFTDGRDTPPCSATTFITDLLENLPGGSCVATVSGRYYAMDRDNRYERTEKAWSAIVHGKGEHAHVPQQAIENSYAKSVTDEFILPTVIGNYEGIQSGDGILMANFRSDRMRSLAFAFSDYEFSGFDRGDVPELSAIASMTQYASSLSIPVLFEKQNTRNGLGETLAKHGYSQLRIAETEKYAHVTYFFNGGVEEPFLGEERCLIPSPRDIATYDQKPSMSAVAITDTLLAFLEKDQHNVVVCNFANMDMVGHTGVMSAAILACECIDTCVERIRRVVEEKKGVLLITADHGNIEEMLSSHGNPQTAHSTNPVPFILADYRGTPLTKIQSEGSLCDIAPTVLSLMHIQKPEEMTGMSLCEEI